MSTSMLPVKAQIMDLISIGADNEPFVALLQRYHTGLGERLFQLHVVSGEGMGLNIHVMITWV